LKHLDPSYLRYYYASKLSPRVDDLDLNRDEFVSRVNADLVGNVVNLASRTARFAVENGLSPRYPDDGGLFEQAARDGEAIGEAYEACDYNRAMRLVLQAGDRANQFIDRIAPWNLRKDPAKVRELQDACTIGLNLFRQLAIYLAPVLPRLAQQTGRLLNDPIHHWDQSKTPLVGKPVGRYEHMMTRARREQVDAMMEESREPDAALTPTLSQGESEGNAPAAPPWQDSEEPLKAEPLVAETISVDEFAKVDLRVARIVEAEDVPEANKLLKLTLSFGGDQRRTVFAGIKAAYRPEELVGRLVISVANLAPRKMKFGTSEGMVLASGVGGKEIFLLSPDQGAQPGQRVH
jgi:methionyl-tRNA synthetase